ncbi:MAG TPA: hypothetical protein VF323_12025 [Candidatus Limnocylindrales bacterium]
MRVLTRVIRYGAVVVAGLSLAGCGVAATRASLPPEPSVALASYPPVVADTRRLVVDALGRDGLTLQDATQPFRPPESPSMTGAPRGVFQVVLPADPTHGYLVIYGFRDAPTAVAAAQDQAAYIGSGPGRIQFPPDTQTVIRQVDTTVIVYSWSPANSTDTRADSIPTDLSTVGIGVPVPR